MNEIVCYVSCLTLSGYVTHLLALTALTSAFFVAFMFVRRSEILLLAQGTLCAIIIFNLALMQCPMISLLWVYLGIFATGSLVIVTAWHLVMLQHKKALGGQLGFISRLEGEMGVTIRVLDTQKIRAYSTGGAIYLSVGLLEWLDRGEIRAVVAHEKYHVWHSPDKIVGSLMALASLTFFRYNDEHLADRYAASLAGTENLKGALRKLNVKDMEERVRQLS